MSRQEYIKKYNNYYTKTIKGLCKKIYHHQLRNCKTRGHSLPTYTSLDLEDLFKEEKSLLVYKEWVSSGYNPELIPSVDRLNNSKSYTLDNIEIVSWKTNKERAYEAVRNKTLHNPTLLNGGHKEVSCFTKEGIFIATYQSVSEAARVHKCQHQQISRACSTTFTFFLDLFWCYTKDTDLKISTFTPLNASIQKEATIKSNGYTIECIDLTSKIATEYTSLASAAHSLKLSPRTIKKYSTTESIYNNKYIFKLKEQI